VERVKSGVDNGREFHYSRPLPARFELLAFLLASGSQSRSCQSLDWCSFLGRYIATRNRVGNEGAENWVVGVGEAELVLQSAMMLEVADRAEQNGNGSHVRENVGSPRGYGLSEGVLVVVLEGWHKHTSFPDGCLVGGRQLFKYRDPVLQLRRVKLVKST